MAESAVMSKVPFLWEGTDRKGKKVKGKSMAADEAHVRADLRRQGVVPSRIKKQGRGLKRGGTIPPGDIAIFSRQLSTMLAAGIPLVQAFEIVGQGHENAAMQKLIMAVKADVEGGSALAEALGKHPLYFDDLFAMAGKLTYMSAERIIPTEQFLDEGPVHTLRIPRIHVDGVIEAPMGAHFTECPPDYGRDEAFQKEYAATAKDPDASAQFRADWLELESHEAYVAKLEERA